MRLYREGNIMSITAGEMEFEAAHYSNPYSNPEMEMEAEWETHEGHPYSNPYSNPEMEWEDESDRFFPLVAKAATKLLPHAVRIGRNLIRGGRRRPALRRSAGRPRQMGSRDQQISALFHQLGRAFAQGESEAATQEAHLFGANEFETEVAANEVAHQAALTEVMAAEASHTESESEAQALLGAALPISMRVMGGRIGIRRLTPALLRVNAQLVLNLHRQGTPGRQLLRVMPSVQRRTVSTLGAIQRSGQPVTPAIATNVMKGQAARVLTTPHICRQALTRNMIVRQQTVAPGGPIARPGIRPGMRMPGRRVYGPGMYRPGVRPGMRMPAGPGIRPGMRTPMGMRRPAGMRVPGGPVRMRSPIAGRPVSPPRSFIQSRPVARPQHGMPARTVSGPRRHVRA
jgi:hypothetical protein